MAGDPGDFTTSFDRLSEAVEEACDGQREWPRRVVAGIDAAVRFAVANPAAALRLVASPNGPEDVDGRRRTIDHFSALLREGAPRGRRAHPVGDEALVSGIATMFDGHLRTERADRLAELAPDMAYFALVPYLGFEEAKRWAGTEERAEGATEGARA